MGSLRKFHSELEKRVFQQLLSVGWPEDSIISEIKTSLKSGQTFVPDFILTYNLYPLAIVEVSNYSRLANAKEQILPLLEESDFLFGLLTDGNQFICFSPSFPEPVLQYQKLPSPKELLQILYPDVALDDPRFAAISSQQTSQVRWHQMMSIKRVLDALVLNRKRIWLSLAQGSGKSFITYSILSKLLNSGYSRRILILTDRLEMQSQLMKQALGNLPEHYMFSRIEKGIPTDSAASIFFAMPQIAEEIVTGSSTTPVLANDFFDLILVQSESYTSSWSYVLDHFSTAKVIAVTGSIQNQSAYNTFITLMGEPVFEYSTTEYVDDILAQPPEGYYSVNLGSIADLRSGLPKTKYKEELTDASEIPVHSLVQPDSISIFSAAMINTDGTINLEKAYKLLVSKPQNQLAMNKYDLTVNDIVISRYTGQGTNRIILVTEDVANRYVIDNSVIRIRLTSSQFGARQVYEFLCSDVGQSYLNNRTRSQTTLPTINIAMLRTMPIFFSQDKQESTSNFKEFTSAGRAIYEIQNNILPLLLEIEQANDTVDGKLQTVAELLTRVTSTLIPLSLEKKVINYFPTPIALTYSRFLKSRFNAFEQVRRLIDLTESIQFFVYNTLLAEFLRRPKDFYVEDAGARRAFNGYSMASRMDFVKAIQLLMKANKGNLFINELADSFDADLARDLTDQLRNRTAHTATAPEGQQRKVLDIFRPKVENLLGQLDFLRNYSLVQIPSFHRKNGTLYRRVYIFRGIDPVLEEQKFDNLALTNADSDHLVLLNSEDDVLDLHPLYQLVTSEETRFETHICFMKQRKQKDSILEGESIQGVFSLRLDGFDYFEQLQAGIVNTPPKE